ncbi:class I SAM-dependent methyltransferase [uncultured Leifsonia sp.]|uniref:class I SAM-dependent DNA methyltransferase n=1 Tax=uncultured Leifsonia sp. TaxID=340359 RepID=UPI0028D4C6D0|nr:class I SAM-dependent methyltransferase [uncultured Leifsonia sp.]
MDAESPTYAVYGRHFAAIYDALFPRSLITSAEVRWLIGLLPPARERLIVEFGVGTGRVALPIARAVREKSTRVIGVDISEEMLERLATEDESGLVTAISADVTSERVIQGADLVMCVCATISMITDPDKQQATFSNAAETLKPGGVLVVETHNAELVCSMHIDGRATLAIPYPGERRVLVSFSELDFPIWRVDHCWIQGRSATFADEVSRLTSLEELDEYARQAGLDSVGHFSGLSGAQFNESSATHTAVYRRPPSLID